MRLEKDILDLLDFLFMIKIIIKKNKIIIIIIRNLKIVPYPLFTVKVVDNF